MHSLSTKRHACFDCNERMVARYYSLPFLLIFLSDQDIQSVAAVVRWKDSAGRLIDGEDRVRASEDGLLTISGAIASDSGNYSCHVDNMAASRSRTLWIVVAGRSRDEALWSSGLGRWIL